MDVMSIVSTLDEVLFDMFCDFSIAGMIFEKYFVEEIMKVHHHFAVCFPIFL